MIRCKMKSACNELEVHRLLDDTHTQRFVLRYECPDTANILQCMQSYGQATSLGDSAHI